MFRERFLLLYLFFEMQNRLLFGQTQLSITIARLCQQLIEKHGDFENTVLLGLQPRGIYFANRIQKELSKYTSKTISLGYLDSTFFRDDFRRRDNPVRANETRIDFLIEDKQVVLIDDVFFTGRSVRAALDAMHAFGRPKKVELMVLVKRKYARHVPVYPDYVGKEVNTLNTQKVLVEWEGVDAHDQDNVWLIDKQ